MSKPVKIGLVDDKAINRNSITDKIKQFEDLELCFSAVNGHDCLEQLKGLPLEKVPQVIFMDLEMPEMDGMSATAEIRRRELTTAGRTPIIAMTAHGVSALRTECLKLGMDGYLTKPIQPQELFDALELVQRKCAEARDLV